MKTIRPTDPGVFPKLEDGVHSVALGNMTQWYIALNRHNGGVYVGVGGGCCYVFIVPPTWEHVAEKLKAGEADAGNMADFIACQLGDPRRNPLGDYCRSLMERGVEHEA